MEKYIRLFIIGLLLLSCDVTDDELILLEPTLELDGRLPMDGNGYYRLELNDSSNQTIHTISGTVGNTLYWDCLLYTSPSPRDATLSRMPSSA